MGYYIKTLLIVFVLILSTSKFSYPQIPAAPTNLSVDYVFSSAISLKWNDNASNEAGYTIERCTDGVSWSMIKILQPNTGSYADIGLLLSTKYYYRIYAFNSSGKSAYSNVVTAYPLASFDCSAGTDTISTPYPFYLSNTDSRTQMLYLKSEMIGYCGVGYIWSVTFFSKATTTTTINGCTIKMKNTADTTLTKFIDTGFSVVSNNQLITLQPNGWTTIYLPQYFNWDVNKNLLIDICFHTNSPTSNNLFLRGTNVTNKVLHRHKNGGNGCTLDSGTVQSLRPNLRLITVIDGVKKISDNTPDKYSIDQNYPNPFNGNTKFKFKVKETSPITLSVYDILGRQEVVVFSEPLTPGEYEKSFSLSEHPLASGIYYYCFVANGFVSVKKMVILK